MTDLGCSASFSSFVFLGSQSIPIMYQNGADRSKGQTVDLVGQTVDLVGQTVDLVGQTVDLVGTWYGLSRANR